MPPILGDVSTSRDCELVADCYVVQTTASLIRVDAQTSADNSEKDTSSYSAQIADFQCSLVCSRAFWRVSRYAGLKTSGCVLCPSINLRCASTKSELCGFDAVPGYIGPPCAKVEFSV